jgi:GntR family transcriptional regulator / MocR family aminotransferase
LNRRAPLPNIALDRTSREALHVQLAAALRRAIHARELPPGATLPSTRALADALGVSRNTVVTAYDELSAEGLILARAGSATRVFGNGAVPRLPDWHSVVRASQYPVDPVRFRDADGNALYFHR